MDYQLAQLNIAQMKYNIDAPEMADFVAMLDDINALADNSAGFVWRFEASAEDTSAVDIFGADYLVNMSVWQDVQVLRQYVYRSAHANVMRQKKQWFDKMNSAYLVLWWVRAGHIPSLDEAKIKLDLLRTQGASQAAFALRDSFDRPAV